MSVFEDLEAIEDAVNQDIDSIVFDVNNLPNFDRHHLADRLETFKHKLLEMVEVAIDGQKLFASDITHDLKSLVVTLQENGILTDDSEIEISEDAKYSYSPEHDMGIVSELESCL